MNRPHGRYWARRGGSLQCKNKSPAAVFRTRNRRVEPFALELLWRLSTLYYHYLSPDSPCDSGPAADHLGGATDSNSPVKQLADTPPLVSIDARPTETNSRRSLARARPARTRSRIWDRSSSANT